VRDGPLKSSLPRSWAWDCFFSLLAAPFSLSMFRSRSLPNPSIRWLSSPQALLAWLRTSRVQQAQPVVDALYEWSHFSVRSIWGMITSAWGSQCIHIFDEIGAQTRGLSWVRQFFEGHDVVSQMQSPFHPVTYRHVTHVDHREASCCRYYLLREGQYCAGCPSISQKEQLQRQQVWMKYLIESQ
jgi:hypothetical protein